MFARKKFFVQGKARSRAGIHFPVSGNQRSFHSWVGLRCKGRISPQRLGRCSMNCKRCGFGMVLKRLILGAADGLSPVVRVGRKAGPAGLRWLLKSPPHHAGQAPAHLRATRFNPCRIEKRSRFTTHVATTFMLQS